MSACVLAAAHPAHAQSPDGQWSEFVNISNSLTASTFPSMAADGEGRIHVLWSEDVGGQTDNPVLDADGNPTLDNRGNAINYLTRDGNTLFYTRWDGQEWLAPIDVQIASGGVLQYVDVAVDKLGVLHAIWVTGDGIFGQLRYASAPAGAAHSAQAWSKPVILAESVLFGSYPAALTAAPDGSLHILYAQVGLDAGAFAINSFDGGHTWSVAIPIYAAYAAGEGSGVSTMRLIADAKGWLHATWTRYDQSGNGKAIYYAQSRDAGQTWSDAFEAASWQPGWYETDWVSAWVVGDEVHLIWEGGKLAYRNELISHDAGLNWGESRRILPHLVGENGFTDVVADSAGQRYLLVVQRGDRDDRIHGIWYAQREQDYWLDPVLLGTTRSELYGRAGGLPQSSTADLLVGSFTGNGLRYQEAAIVNGNELFVIVVNEFDGEIWSSRAVLPAPRIAPVPYPDLPPTPTVTPRPTATPVAEAGAEPGAPATRVWQASAEPAQARRGIDPLAAAIIPVSFLLIGWFVVTAILKRAQA